MLAIDFGGTKIAACTCTGGGRWLSDDVVATTPALGADANFGRGISLARRLLGGSRLLAVGACTFGIPEEDGVRLSPAIAGWDELPLRRSLEDALGAPAVVATDVKVAAAAEVRHGALAEADPAIYLNLGTGLAAAIVSGGTVLRGAHGAAGEIGYALPRRVSTVPRTSSDGDRRDDHDVRILEDLVSGMGLARALVAMQWGDDSMGAGDPATREAVAAHSPVATDGHDGRRDARGDGRRDPRRALRRRTGDAERVARLFAAAERGDDPRAERVLDDFLEELGFHLANLTIAIDPERIAVGGGMVRAWDLIAGSLRRSLQERVPYPPELVLGAYPFDASLRGAADLALDLAARAEAS